MQNVSQSHVFKLIHLLAPLLGYKREPITTLTLTYLHPRGSRIGLNLSGQHWYNCP